jgi:hypothetical protein
MDLSRMDPYEAECLATDQVVREWAASIDAAHRAAQRALAHLSHLRMRRAELEAWRELCIAAESASGPLKELGELLRRETNAIIAAIMKEAQS